MDTVTIPKAEYERLKEIERKSFLAEFEEALRSGIEEPLIEVQPKF